MNVDEDIRNYISENILFGGEVTFADDASFQELGIIDSLGFLDLITFLEGRYGIKVEDEEVVPENFDSLKAMVRFVEGKLSCDPV